MNKSNVIKILKTQYEIHIPKFIGLILGVLAVSLLFFVILRQQFEYIPLIIPVYSYFIFSYTFLNNNETTLYILSGCSRKDIAMTNFIVYLSVSIFFILNYILISVLFFSVNNLFFIHINIILIGLSVFNILICLVLIIVNFLLKIKYKENISMTLRIILIFVPLLLPRLIAKYQFSEEFTKPSNLMIFVFLYIISLIIHLLFNNYILSKRDFII